VSCIVTRSGVPLRIKLRAAVRKQSCTFAWQLSEVFPKGMAARFLAGDYRYHYDTIRHTGGSRWRMSCCAI
jgi:hypothetical protein